jgi:paraquat-inducible protein B
VPYFFNMKKPLQIAFNRGIPVLIRVEAARLYDSLTLPELQQELDSAVHKGLRAVLKTGNLLTGGLYVDLNIVEGAADNTAATQSKTQQSTGAVHELAGSDADAGSNTHSGVVASALSAPALDEFAGYRLMPTARSGLGHIEQKVLQALDKINNLPVEQVLADSSATLNETRELMSQSQQLVRSLDALIGKDSTQQLPAELKNTLQQLQQTLQGMSPGSPVYERLNSNLQAMDKVLRDIQPVVQTMNQQSNALVISADPKADPEPEQGVQP